MSSPAPSPGSWSHQITWETAQEFPIDSGIPDLSAERVLPVAFEIAQDAASGWIWVATEAGQASWVPLEQAGLTPFTYPGLTGLTVLLRHRKGGATAFEDFYRLLALGPESEFRFGMKLPDHEGQEGVYLGARHIGTVSLDLAEVQILPEPQQAFKFFPIGPAQDASRPGFARRHSNKDMFSLQH